MSLIILAVVAILIFMFLFFYPIVVYEGEVIILERFGKMHKVMGPGVHFIARSIDSLKTVDWTYDEEDDKGKIVVSRKHDYRIHHKKEVIFDPAATPCTTTDHVRVTPNVVIFYRIVDPIKCVYEVDDLYRALQTTLASTLQHTISDINFDTYISEKGHLVTVIKDKLKDASRWGLEITKIELQDLGLPSSIVTATEKLRTQEKESLAKKKAGYAAHEQAMAEQQSKMALQELTLKTQWEKAEHDKRLAIEKANWESKIKADQLVAEAEAKSRSIRLVAEAESYRMQKMFGDSCSDRQSDYYMAQLYSEAWKSLNPKAIVVPYEASKFLGAAQSLNLVMRQE